VGLARRKEKANPDLPIKVENTAQPVTAFRLRIQTRMAIDSPVSGEPGPQQNARWVLAGLISTACSLISNRPATFFWPLFGSAAGFLAGKSKQRATVVTGHSPRMVAMIFTASATGRMGQRLSSFPSRRGGLRLVVCGQPGKSIPRLYWVGWSITS